MERIVDAIKFSADHPLFYPHIFDLVLKEEKLIRKAEKTRLILRTLVEEYEQISRRLDRSLFQESHSVRNILRARKLASLLVDEKGNLHISILPSLISYLKSHLYCLGPERHYDGVRQEHILKVLEALYTRKDLQLLLKKFTRPISNKWADHLIRESLRIPSTVPITDAHTIQAVLSAWLSYLRQNVGSCFATAPAEIIHDEQPEQFLQDLLDLLATGSLKRTFGGIENSVPLSISWGSGDLKKPILIENRDLIHNLAYSPGLQFAFEAIRFINPKDTKKEKWLQIKEWIKEIHQKKSVNEVMLITAEQILRYVILKKLELSESVLKEYEKKSGQMHHQHLFFGTGFFSEKIGGRSKEHRCAQFYTLLEQAKNAFKSLSDHALLKGWEYTLASFSDIKYEFGRWNFYASLGLETDQKHGIGQCIYQIIQEKWNESNKKVEEIQIEYEMIFTKIKTLESRMRQASTEQEMQWLKVEYESNRNEFFFLQEQRDVAQRRIQSLVHLYDTLYELYVELFKDYFQEVYDAELQEIESNPFDDSPAGFRLVYKHGRSHTALWSHINNQEQFIEALTSFFIATEPQIAHALQQHNIEKDLSEVVTAIINHIKTKDFLESAFHRMAEAHQTPLIVDPLSHTEHAQKKPWVYTSGGTMNTLVSCYYHLEQKPKEVEKWVESEMELLIFFADTIKGMPSVFLDPYAKNKRKSMLMHSPTHVFLLQPMRECFKEIWINDEFTYTFVRDRFVLPSEIFVEQMLLQDEMIQFLLDELSKKIPKHLQARFHKQLAHLSGPLSPIFFRDQLLSVLQREFRNIPFLSTEEIDGFLYCSLPLCPIHELKNSLQKICHELPNVSKETTDRIMLLLEQIPFSSFSSFLTACQLQNVCKALLCLSEMRTSSPIDYHFFVALATQKLGLAMPTPIIFADSNWSKDFFGFAINPGSGKLELWRLDYTGARGFPMTSWKQWINGTRSDRKWGIYTKPFEYGQV